MLSPMVLAWWGTTSLLGALGLMMPTSGGGSGKGRGTKRTEEDELTLRLRGTSLSFSPAAASEAVEDYRKRATSAPRVVLSICAPSSGVTVYPVWEIGG
jgi:hypothetical protein